MRRKILFIFFISSLLFLLDRCIKQFSSEFSGACNQGVSFGLFIGWGLSLSLFGIFLFFILFSFLESTLQSWWFLFGTSIFLAGAASNILDRFYFGCIRDTFHFSHWFIFNVSDILLFFGALCLILALFFKKNRPLSTS